MIRRNFYIATLSVLLHTAAAQAADGVPVRVGAHEGYARLVFDWPEGAQYTVGQDADSSLVVTFDKAAAAAIAGDAATAAPQIAGVTQLSGADEKLRIKIVPGVSGAQFRHFKVGNRIVVDVLSPGGTAAKSAPAPLAPAKKEEKPAVKAEKPQPEKTAAVEPKKESAPPPSVVAAKPAEPVRAEPIPAAPPARTAIEAAMPAIEPHAITLPLTETVGMAAFVRNGYLWIVLDRPDISVPPKVDGPTPEKFPPFTRYELKGGVAFRMKLPGEPGLKLYGEGGGLVWRVIATPKERAVKPAALERIFEEKELVRGGTAFWPLAKTRRILDVPDPGTGDVLKAVTVDDSGQFTGAGYSFVDFSVMESVIGMAVKPEADDVDVTLTGNGVKVGRPGGLAMSRQKDVMRKQLREDVAEAVIEAPADPAQQMKRIYDFDRWMMGGLQAMGQNQRILMAGASAKDKNGRVQDLLTLAKISIANDRGQEALGFLNYAIDEIPDLVESAEFVALRGAAYALAGKYELAMQDFRSPALKDYNELDYWRAFTLAWLEDWQQAKAVMPQDYFVLVGYPKALLEKLGIKLSEVALRSGDTGTAEKILAALEKEKATLKPWTISGLDYLKGEADRQEGDSASAMKLWEPLSKGRDDFYRARAGLALTMAELQDGKTERKAAIDRLEGLRYAWRGDELEAQINYMLGKLYLEDRQFAKGFGILRDAASMSPDSDISREIPVFMADRFKDLLMNDGEISPVDAVTVYEQFRELTPEGAEGDRLVQKLAERLVEADLLGRAAAILQHQVDYRLQGMEKAGVAVRLAAIYLLDKTPDKAIAALDAAKPLYESDAAPESKKALHNIEMMRARALSQQDKTEEALALLHTFDPSPEVNRLRADIAWQAGLWEDAAEALQDMILDEALDLGRPLTDAQADLVLNRAVALNLSGNRVALANMRKRYEDSMKKTARTRLFDVVTRPRQSTLLSDKQTLDSLVSEVDIFKDFLEAYKKDGGLPSN